MKGKYRVLIFLFFIFLFDSCAVKVAPTGGPKDTASPKVIKCVPENSSSHFHSGKILIRFDEFIQVKDINGQMISSPILNNEPEVRIRGKSLQIELQDTLKENTTYTINFGNAITDAHENNPLENFQYVFSTGDFVDSLLIKGKVVNAKNLGPEKSINVMLYNRNEDSLPLKEKPLYFAKTKADGSFNIRHLAHGEYKIVALKDANANYLFDLPNESFAFSDTALSSPRDSVVNLFLFDENREKQRLVKAYSDFPGKAVLVFKKPVRHFDIRELGGTNEKATWDFQEGTTNNDTLIFWISSRPPDTLHWKIKCDDGNTDTLEMSIRLKESTSLKKKTQKPKLNVSSNFTNGGAMDLSIKPEIYFSQPIREYDLSKIVIEKDSVPLKNVRLFFSDSSKRKLVMDYMPEEKSNFRFFIPPGTFTDIFGFPNDTIEIKFKTKALKEYGSMALKVILPERTSSYIIQLLDEKENVLREDFLTGTGRIPYTLLNPGKYKLKMIYDRNNNKRWDTGNYLQKVQPEKVVYCSETVSIRANWDIEQEWKP